MTLSSLAGVSNLVTGLTGAGFTGSYIFSQTIFSMRAGVATRIHGLIIAGSEFALFALPISIVQYLPVRPTLNLLLKRCLTQCARTGLRSSARPARDITVVSDRGWQLHLQVPCCT